MTFLELSSQLSALTLVTVQTAKPASIFSLGRLIRLQRKAFPVDLIYNGGKVET